MNYLEMPEVSVAVGGMHVGIGGQSIVSRSRPGPDRNCGRRKHPLHAESGRSLPQQPSLRLQAKRCISGGAAARDPGRQMVMHGDPDLQCPVLATHAAEPILCDSLGGD